MDRSQACRSPPRSLATLGTKELIAEVSDHCWYVEVVAEVVRRHRSESRGAIWPSKRFLEERRIIDLSLGADLLRIRRSRRGRGGARRAPEKFGDAAVSRSRLGRRCVDRVGHVMLPLACWASGERLSARIEQSFGRRIKSGRDDRDLDLILHLRIDDGTEDDIGLVIRGILND